ncbi:MAG: outer membrane beta-barrel protein [Gammaproteobacteria bacterium]|nr:outer membrane beta-barrel protein [Gammaproteobacteria bacterium]
MCNNILRNQVNSFSIMGLFLVVVLSVASENTQAYEFNAGFGLGTATLTESYDFDDGSLSNINVDDSNLAIIVYGEMEFSPYLRMEFGIIDGGVNTVGADSDGSGLWVNGPVDIEYGIAGIKVGAVGAIPLTPRNKLKLILKGGLIHWISIVNMSDSVFEYEEDVDTGIAPYVGIGLEIDVTPFIAVRLQHEQFTVDAHSDWFLYDYSFEYSNVTAGMVFRF